jgi:hydrogenase expression/formation protein HypE
MRDLTRGGLSSALVEITQASKLGININEKNIPVEEDVRGACEILGFDPLYVANEGRFITFLPENEAQKALDILNSGKNSQEAYIIGKVTESNAGLVIMRSTIGATRIVDMLSGEQLPRIC